MLAAMTRFWHGSFVALYRLLGMADPLIRAWWARAGLGNVIELRVASRRSARQRSLLLGLLRTSEGLYLGHPDGPAAWTRDFEAAGSAELILPGTEPVTVRGIRLGPGAEREAVIGATGQHPFPGNLIYRLARAHVRARGVYYRLEPAVDADT
jgi:hypothetical protein